MAPIVVKAYTLKPGEFKGSPRHRDYKAIGEFVTACSLLEVTLHLVIRPLLQVKDQVVRRLIGEPRLGDLIDLFKFAISVQEPLPLTPQADALIARLLSRVRYANNVRSIVAHKPCNTDGISLEFHNRLTAKVASNRFQYICTATQLKNCADHVLEVAHALRGLLTYSEKTAFQWEGTCNELLASVDRLDLPNPPSDQSPQIAPKPKPRPPSSRKKSQ
jgi:hypothetical protein